MNMLASLFSFLSLFNTATTSLPQQPLFGAPITRLERTLLPETDSLYDLGTSTRAWRDGFFDQLCFTADTCRTSWPAAGASFAWTPNAWGNSTSTTIGLLNGFISTASSTFSSNTYFTSPSAGLGYLGSLGKLNTTATSSPTFSSPLTTSGTAGYIVGGSSFTVGVQDAAADGSTKGAASFTAADFDASTGNIALDYTNGQKASASQAGFLSSTDWTTFNNKLSSYNAFTQPTYAGTIVSATTSPLWLTATTPFSLIASSTFATGTSTIGYGDTSIVESGTTYYAKQAIRSDESSTGAATIYERNATDCPLYGCGIWNYRSRGDRTSKTVVSSGDWIASWYNAAYDGTDYEPAAMIRSEVDGTPGNNDMPGRITFWTTPDGSATLAERLRISNTGYVGVATTSPGTVFSIGDTTGWNFIDNGTTTSNAKGIDLKGGGCFAINGTCISSGTTYTATWPISVSGSAISWAGLATTSQPTAGQLLYSNGTTGLTPVSTSSIAIGSTLSVASGSFGYQVGGSAVTFGINLGNANAWTALQTFANASSSKLSCFGTCYFGGTSTTTIDVAGSITLPSAATLDASAATALKIPASTSQTPGAAGSIAVDTTSDEFKWYGTALNITRSYYTTGFSIASTTGTTTIRLAPAAAALTMKSVRCDSSTFVDVSLYDGTNRANYVKASSTIGTITYSTNNTFTDGEAIRVDVGTSTASTDYNIACRFKYTYDAD